MWSWTAGVSCYFCPLCQDADCAILLAATNLGLCVPFKSQDACVHEELAKSCRGNLLTDGNVSLHFAGHSTAAFCSARCKVANMLSYLYLYRGIVAPGTVGSPFFTVSTTPKMRVAAN